MDKCWKTPPDLYRTDEHRIVRCFLFEDQPDFVEKDISVAFR